MKIEMLSTGDEVLQGDIVDSNAAWAGHWLADQGLKFSRRQTVADELDDIVEALEQAAKRSDWVLVNGGLGPTTDDLSAEAAAKLIGQPLCERLEWRVRLEAWYKKQNKLMPSSNLKQTMLPLSAQFVDNPVGTACGFIVEHHGAKLLFTPGVPSEFKVMLEQQWRPLLQAQIAKQSASTYHTARFFTFGLSESVLNDRFTDLEFPEGIKMGYRSSRPLIEVKLAGDKSLPQWSYLEQQLRSRLAEHTFCEQSISWAAHLQRLMVAAGKKLVLAESCTGGMLAAKLIAEAGSSSYLERGYVTYSNAAKLENLTLDQGILEQHGAVSEAVAIAMAQGALANSHADLAISITGVAGPEGGSVEKPVGTVCFALASTEHVYCQRLLIANRDRQAIRVMATAVAMDMLRRYLQNQTVLASYDNISTVNSSELKNNASDVK